VKPTPHTARHTHFGPETSRVPSRLALSLGLTLGFVLIEAAAGLLANSLALLTDAAHNLTDVIALGLSWYALRLTTQPSGPQKTYGYHRAGILVALVNSTTLVLISCGIFYEAFRRLIDPPEVNPQILMVVGVLAVGINLCTALLIRRRGERDLNLRSLFLHLMGDVASTGGAVLAGVAIFFTGANWIDPLVSVFIGLLIIYSAWGIVSESVEILLEAAPRDLDVQAMVTDVLRVDGVIDVHDLHVWSLSSNLRTMSAHVLTEDIAVSAGAEIKNEVTRLLAERYSIAHATLQLWSAQGAIQTHCTAT
jgi:cobalt-zinc-cadmium efflux system protein